MSRATEIARPQTKIFGLQIGVDPKILVGGLIVLAVLLFWFNSGGEGGSSSSTAGSRGDVVAQPVVAVNARKVTRRNRSNNVDRGTLRIRPVDATHGDIDPTLRLELLNRLQSVTPAKPGRSLFEIGPDPVTEAAKMQAAALLKGPVVPVISSQQQFPTPPQPQTPQVNIPLKFYGFARPAAKGETQKGLFLDGDNVLVASEGELIDHRFLVRELSANDARVEDTQIKQGQTLHVVPEARPQ